MMTPDLNKLDHFVAVAEALNFTQAATRLHMAQQALSASIRRLEQELGVQLFERSTRRVTLTVAGEQLLREGRPLLASSRATWENVRRTARGGPSVVRVGLTPTVPGDQLDAYLVAWRLHRPDVGIVVTQHWIDELLVHVADGRLDVGLSRVIEPSPELTSTTLGQRPLRVAMDVGHRLADEPLLEFADLAGESFLEAGPLGKAGAHYRLFFVGLCHRAGFEPTLVPTPVQGPPPVAAVAGTDHVALVDAPAGALVGGKVVVREFLSAPLMPVSAVTRATAVSDAVREFIEAAAGTMPVLAPVA